jgi:hypothetical protein
LVGSHINFDIIISILKRINRSAGLGQQTGRRKGGIHGSEGSQPGGFIREQRCSKKTDGKTSDGTPLAVDYGVRISHESVTINMIR